MAASFMALITPFDLRLKPDRVCLRRNRRRRDNRHGRTTRCRACCRGQSIRFIIRCRRARRWIRTMAFRKMGHIRIRACRVRSRDRTKACRVRSQNPIIPDSVASHRVATRGMAGGCPSISTTRCRAISRSRIKVCRDHSRDRIRDCRHSRRTRLRCRRPGQCRKGRLIGKRHGHRQPDG